MTQIINDKLKKICNNCRYDKSCAWISLGNEYCDDIMEAQHEIERLKKENKILKDALLFIFRDYKVEEIDIEELKNALNELKNSNWGDE